MIVIGADYLRGDSARPARTEVLTLSAAMLLAEKVFLFIVFLLLLRLFEAAAADRRLDLQCGQGAGRKVVCVLHFVSSFFFVLKSVSCSLTTNARIGAKNDHESHIFFVKPYG